MTLKRWSTLETRRALALNEIREETKNACVENLTEGNVDGVEQGPDALESEAQNCVCLHRN